MDRLTAILLLLQESKRPRTAEELADHFEVSRRTILRDMMALFEMGVPVEGQQGAGGGYRLPAEFGVRPLPLTANESMLMLLALSAIERLADAPFARERETLRAKLKTLIAPHHAERLDAALSAVAYEVPERTSRTPHLERLLECAADQSWVRVRYQSAEQESVQTLQPTRLYTAGGFWYLRAFSAERGAERTYRADRILSIESAEVPADVLRINEAPYDDEAHPEVIVELTARGIERVETEQHLGQALLRNADGTGRLQLRCPPSELRWFTTYLLGLGLEATVMAPPELRESLRAAALAVAERHSVEKELAGQ